MCRALDSRGRDRKTSAGTLAGVERRKDIFGRLLETAFHAAVPLHAGDGKEELDSLLQQSVREHMISDVPLGSG